MSQIPEPYCIGCDTFARDMPYLDSFLDPGEYPNDSRADYVRREEGTLNTYNGHFLCDSCYIRAGQPVGPYGSRWTAP